MNYTLPELDERTIIHLKIDGTRSLSSALVGEINRACDSAEDTCQEAVVFIHLSGQQNQENICQPWPGNVDMRLLSQWEKVLRRLERLTAVTITVMEHTCGGVALEVLLTTDYRIVTNNLRIYLQSPFKEIWPGMIVHRLANQLGVTRARWLILFGTEITGQKIAELGLADEVVTDVMAALSNFTRILKSISIADIAVRRRLLLDANATSFEDALGVHLAACDRVLQRHSKLPIESIIQKR